MSNTKQGRIANIGERLARVESVSEESKPKRQPASQTIALQNTGPSTSQEVHRCTSCGQIYSSQKRHFLISLSPLFAGNGGFLPVCKNCAISYYHHMVDFFKGNEVKAIDKCCQVFDWYFNEEACDMVIRAASDTPIIVQYRNKLSTAKFRPLGSTYADTFVDRSATKINSETELRGAIAADSGFDVDEDEEEETKRRDLTDDERQEAFRRFGAGYTNDEYTFLFFEYEDWTKRYECSTKAHEELFKNIAITQLNVRRAQQRNDSRGVSDTMKTLQDLMNTAGIKPKKIDEGASEVETYGQLIRQLEETEPIPIAQGEWKDPDKIKSLIEAYFLGHMCNLLHVQNAYNKAYEDEMREHSVKPPQYDDDDDASVNLFSVGDDGSAPNYDEEGGDDDGE